MDRQGKLVMFQFNSSVAGESYIIRQSCEMRGHRELWRAADMADGVPSRKSPFMLLILNLIRKVHMGEFDGVSQELFIWV